MREFLVHVFNGGKVHGSILPNRRMRTAACLDPHNAFRRQSLRACENELVFLRVNIVGNHVNVVVVPKPLAQGFNQRGFARTNRAADPDAQRSGLGVCITIKSHERNNLVYWVSCAMEARSTMNAADPRSSIVALSASTLAARIACSSSAMASWPSVCPRGTSRTPAVTRLAT